MKPCIIFIVGLLFICPGLGYAQALKADASDSGESSTIRVPMQPESNKRMPAVPVTAEPSKLHKTQAVPEAPSAPANPVISVDPLNRLLWGDFNGDKLQDLLVLDLNGNHLLKNLGDGGFEDVTDKAFHNGADRGVSGSWGDFNEDGLIDLFLFHADGFTLYRNDGSARFTDVTEAMDLDPGLAGSQAKVEDYDGDGQPDLIVKTPGGDRIFNNRDGRGFRKIDLPGVDDEDASPAIGSILQNGWTSTIPPAAAPPGGDVTPSGNGVPPYPEPAPSTEEDDTSTEKSLSWNDMYINDNSPGSVGLGVPEVEGGNDASIFNDIVDGTITGSDLDVPLVMTGNASQSVVDVTNSSTTTGAAGVRGYVSTASGENSGVYGLTASQEGFGVLGEGPDCGVQGRATATSGWNWAVRGETESTKGHGVAGYALADNGNTFGVLGRSYSPDGKGVYGYASASSGENFGVLGQTNSPDGCGLKGDALATTGHSKGVYGITNGYNGRGVFGESTTTSGTSYGVYGVNASTTGAGVYGASPNIAVHGNSTGSSGMGVYGVCYQSGGTGVKGSGWTYGVQGTAGSNGTTYGVHGRTNADEGFGVFGEAEKYAIRGNATNTSGLSYGVRGDAESTAAWAVYGTANAGTGFTRGVYGYSASTSGTGVYGWAAATSGTTYGVYGKSGSADGYGVYGVNSASGGYGGYFIGGTSTDSLVIRGGSDLSEQFDINSAAKDITPEPGMVVCIDAERPGELTVSTRSHDRTVAGIISGAGGIDTGMLMGQEGTKAHGDSPVALTGRVYCFADATDGAIQPGDLLTTSDIPGHAMKVIDHVKAQGAVIGKAMTSLESGRGLVLVLVSLQ